MKQLASRTNSRKGFALIVVLAFLIILTILLSIAANRNVAQAGLLKSEVTLLENEIALRDTLSILESLDPSVFDGNQTVEAGDYKIHIQDVGGLIDLNTASPELLDIIFEELELDSAARQSYLDWRREGRRLLRVVDFQRVTGASRETIDWLGTVATVHSGRRGVSLEVISEELSDRLGGILLSLGSSPRSGTNYILSIEQGQTTEMNVSVSYHQIQNELDVLVFE